MADLRFASVESFRSFQDEHARLLKAIWCILQSKWAKSVRRFVETYTDEYIDLVLRRVQIAFRKRRSRDVIRKWRALHQELEFETRKVQVVSKLQSMWRAKMTRRRFERMARDTVKKYIESDTGRTYWVCNGRSTWTKPKCLGDSDVTAVTLASEIRQVRVMCEICHSRCATSSCIDCNEVDRVFLCGQCFHEYHQGHEYREIAVCCECEFQVATRVCTSSCQDRFCDTCFHAIHRHGKMATHTWRPLMTMCEICEAYAAKGTCTNEETGSSRYSCIPCFELELERGGTDTWSDVFVQPTYRSKEDTLKERLTEVIKLSVCCIIDLSLSLSLSFKRSISIHMFAHRYG